MLEARCLFSPLKIKVFYVILVYNFVPFFVLFAEQIRDAYSKPLQVFIELSMECTEI